MRSSASGRRSGPSAAAAGSSTSSHRMSRNVTIPSPDPVDEEDEVQHIPASTAATPSSPSKYPQRNRKRNRLFYDELDGSGTYVTSSPARSAGGSSQRSSQKSSQGPSGPGRGGRASAAAAAAAAAVDSKLMEKRNAQRVGLSLRTLLKLPKAHRWVCYEWFYANIDQPLFLAENDFELYLRESFPQLKTRLLRRPEWRKVRRLMGKPRRCSSAFFQEERQVLNAKRSKIRYLQQQKVVDIREFRDLPPNIPLSLVIGSRVTAILRRPSDGLFTGTLDAVDQHNGMYRITFDRPGIGSLDVPDYEVQSLTAAQFMPLASFQSKVRPRMPVCTPKYLEMLESQVNHVMNHDTDPLISGIAAAASTGVRIKSEHASHQLNHQLNLLPNQQQQQQSSISNEEGALLGGFPIKFLVLLVRLSKILAVKKRKIYELRLMNSEAETLRSLRKPLTHEFQKHYANTILDLEKLNTDLNDYLKTVQQFSADLCPDGLSVTENLSAKYHEEGKELAERSLLSHAVGNSVTSEKSIDMISKLLSLLLHLRGFADTEVSSYELKSLNDGLQEVKQHILPQNRSLFENNVEIHVNHIQSSLSHLGNLGAFAESAAGMNGVGNNSSSNNQSGNQT